MVPGANLLCGQRRGRTGVNYIQGYYFGKPVPAKQFEYEYLGKVLNDNK